MITTRRRFNVVIALLILLALAACGGAPATAPPAATGEAGPATEPADQSPAAGSTPVSEDAAAPASPPPTATVPFEGEGPWEADFGTADGVTLHGTLFGGEASTGIVLAPNYPGGAASWQPFAGAAAERGYRALAFDLRGHGESGGEADLAAAPDDVAAAVAFLREQGVERIILMGGGEGAMAVILAAASGEDIAGLAAISPMREDDGLAVAEADLAGLNIPSLWIGARTDMEHDAEGMAGQAGGEPEVWIYEGSSLHGTYLFEGIDAPDLTERLLGFAESAAGG